MLTTSADAERIRDAGRQPERCQPFGQPQAERGAGECTGQDSDKRDADLHAGQESARVGCQRQRAA